MGWIVYSLSEVGSSLISEEFFIFSIGYGHFLSISLNYSIDWFEMNKWKWPSWDSSLPLPICQRLQSNPSSTHGTEKGLIFGRVSDLFLRYTVYEYMDSLSLIPPVIVEWWPDGVRVLPSVVPVPSLSSLPLAILSLLLLPLRRFVPILPSAIMRMMKGWEWGREGGNELTGESDWTAVSFVSVFSWLPSNG